jgi:flagellar biogenesis protein FliO
MADAAALGALVLLVLFVVLVALAVRREVRRQAGWAREAARLGLEYAKGDPLGLAQRLTVDRVEETVFGVVEGVEVAALTVGRRTARADEDLHHTWTIAVREPRSERPVVLDEREGWSLTYAPAAPGALEGLLREAARA